MAREVFLAEAEEKSVWEARGAQFRCHVGGSTQVVLRGDPALMREYGAGSKPDVSVCGPDTEQNL